MLGRLLLILTEDVDVPARLVGSVRGVVASPVLAQSADLLHLLGEKLDLLEVVTDARRGDRLGDDTVATNLGPGEAMDVVSKGAWYPNGRLNVHDVSPRDLSARALGDSLSDLLDLGAGDQKRNVEHVVAKGLDPLAWGHTANQVPSAYRVGSDVDVLLCAVFNQIVALEHGVTLDLVGSGHDAGAVDEGLKLSGVSACRLWVSTQAVLNGRFQWCGWRHQRSGPCSWAAGSWL